MMEKKLPLRDWKALRKTAKRTLGTAINKGDVLTWYKSYCSKGLGYTALGRLIMQRED